MFSYVNTELSARQRGVFIHIPRTAGTSISRHIHPQASRMYLAHATASFVKYQLDMTGPAVWDKLFTFAFVRNPWERLVSWYLFYRRHRKGRKVLPFHDFIQRDSMIMGSFAHNGWTDTNLWSQAIFLTDNATPSGNIMVDFVGKYENIDEDFAYICSKLELPMHIRKKNNVAAYNYKDYYTDEDAARVEKLCAWEIKQFGYKFETK